MHEDQLEPNAVSPSLNSLTKQGEKKRIAGKNQFRKTAERFIENLNKTTARKHHGKGEEMLNQDLNRHSSAIRKRKCYDGKRIGRTFFVLIFFVIFSLKFLY